MAVLPPTTTPLPDLPPQGAYKGRFFCQAAFGAVLLNTTCPLRFSPPSCPRRRASRGLGCVVRRRDWIPAFAGMTKLCDIQQKTYPRKPTRGEGTRMRSSGDETSFVYAKENAGEVILSPGAGSEF